MPAKVILNPYSNRWNAKKRWPEAEAALRAAGIEFSLAISGHPRQPVDLAEEAVREGFSPIIVAGGDGTIGDTINGIGRVKKGEHFGLLGIMPLGTANDMAPHADPAVLNVNKEKSLKILTFGGRMRLCVIPWLL